MDIYKNPKLRQVMNKILETELKITHEQLNLLLNHLTQKRTSEVPADNSVLQVSDDDEEKEADPFFFSWLKLAVTRWEITKSFNPDFAWFILNLASIIVEEEANFVKLNSDGTLKKLLALAQKFIKDNSALYDVQLSYCKVFCAILKHTSGFQWLLLNNSENEIKAIAINNPGYETFKECCIFTALLLEKSANENKLLCINIMKGLTMPFINYLAFNPKTEKDFNSITKAQNELILHLKFLVGILEELLEYNSSKNNFKLFVLFKEKFSLYKLIESVKVTSRNEFLLAELESLSFILIYFEVAQTGGEQITEMEKADRIFKYFIKLSYIPEEAAKRGNFRLTFKCSHKALAYFYKIKSNLPKKTIDKNLSGSFSKFENQMVALQLVPVVGSTRLLLGLELGVLDVEDDLREEMNYSLMKTLTQRTMRIILESKKYLAKISLSDNTAALSYILKSKTCYSRKNSNYVIQSLIYLLEDIINVMKTQSENCALLTEEYLCTLLEVITELVQEFYTTWSENLQSLNLTEISYNFLSFQIASTKLVIKGLELLNVAIGRYMSPSMVLLVESEDVLINNIGFLLLEKLFHENKEIRKLALQVVHTIATNSKSKFPSFRKVLQANNFPSLVYNYVVNDADTSIKVTAIRCLQEISEVPEVCIDLLKIPNIQEELIKILLSKGDTLVLVEVAELVTRLYDVDVIEELSTNFFNAMTHLVFQNSKRLKIKALEFWRKVIDVALKCEGMVDGKFPDATFSKELKRIIHFDRPKIKKCLHNVLNKLSENGCLSVFVHIIKNESSVQVCETAIDCFGDLTQLIKKYDITPSTRSDSHFSSLPFEYISPATNFSEILELGSPAGPNTTDFESIDVEDLEPCPVNKDVVMNDSENMFNKFICVNDFLKFIYQQLDSCHNKIQTRTKSEENFLTFLDEILSNYKIRR